MCFIWEEEGGLILSLLVYLPVEGTDILNQWGREKISTWEQERQKKPRSHWGSLSIRKIGEVADGKMNEVNEGLI